MLPAVPAELHRIAERRMQGERTGHSLQATALVNEPYIRLVDARKVHWQDRTHFLAMAARLMRRVLVDRPEPPLLSLRWLRRCRCGRISAANRLVMQRIEFARSWAWSVRRTNRSAPPGSAVVEIEVG